MKKFTDRFIEFPINVFNRKDVEILGITEELSPSVIKINPFEIATYYADEQNENEGVTIVLRGSADTTFITLPLNEFENRLNKFKI